MSWCFAAERRESPPGVGAERWHPFLAKHLFVIAWNRSLDPRLIASLSETYVTEGLVDETNGSFNRVYPDIR